MTNNFQILSRKEGDRFTQVRRLTCCICDAHHDITAGTLSGEGIAKRFRAIGWDVDNRGVHRALCPSCVSRKKEKATVTTKTAAAPAAESAADREPTSDQRAAIRRLLDANFDDKVGAYLDGYSDQRIGKELNVPWSWVQRLREAAYGPIRVDPALTRLQESIQALQGEMANMDTRFQKEAALIQSQIAAVRAEFDRIKAGRAA